MSWEKKPVNDVVPIRKKLRKKQQKGIMNYYRNKFVTFLEKDCQFHTVLIVFKM